jgi:hypothetical protein
MRACPSIDWSTRICTSGSGSISSTSAPHREQSLNRDIGTLQPMQLQQVTIPSHLLQTKSNH